MRGFLRTDVVVEVVIVLLIEPIVPTVPDAGFSPSAKTPKLCSIPGINLELVDGDLRGDRNPVIGLSR